MRPTSSLTAAVFVLLSAVSVKIPAQGAPPAQAGPPAGQQGPAGPPQGGRGRGATFPAQQRPAADPAVIARGKALYDINCRACHGADLRGGDQGGPNLLRSPVALNDVDGESIGPVVQNGRQNPGMAVMPPLPLPPDDIKAIATYVRSVLASARGQGAPPAGPPVTLNIVVGDPAVGQTYFAATCSACHSVTGDLRGLATRVPDPMQLQNFWVSGGGGGGRRGGRGAPPPTPSAKPRDVMVAVTSPTGERIEGRLLRLDDFMVVLADAEGMQRSFRRDGDVPKVEIRDPLEPHKKLLLTYTDEDIHNVTAYLVTLK